MATTVPGLINKKGQKFHGGLNGLTEVDNFGEATEASWDVKQRVAFMDEVGIHTQIAFPQATGFSSVGMIEKVKDAELRNELIRLFNMGGAEVQKESGNRILPQALLPVWDKDATLVEMQRCKDMGLTGFTVADAPEHSGMPCYDEPYWEGFWDFLNQTKMPLDFHIGGSAVFDAFLVPWKNFGGGAKPGDCGHDVLHVQCGNRGQLPAQRHFRQVPEPPDRLHREWRGLDPVHD